MLTLWCEALDNIGDIDDKTSECILDLIESEFDEIELSRSSRLPGGLLQPVMPIPYATNININGFKSSFRPRKPLWSKDDFRFLSGIDTLLSAKVFVLRFIQARNPDWVQRPFFARFYPNATWFDQLKPAFGGDCVLFREGSFLTRFCLRCR